MVIRDSSGIVQLCAVTKVDLPLHSEIKTILFGLEIARNNSFLSLIVESDSLIAVQEISKKQVSYCERESLILDIMDLSLEFQSCNFIYIRRSTNACAHNIR